MAIRDDRQLICMTVRLHLEKRWQGMTGPGTKRGTTLKNATGMSLFLASSGSCITFTFSFSPDSEPWEHFAVVYWTTVDFSTGRISYCLLRRWLILEFMTSDHVISVNLIGHISRPREWENKQLLSHPIGLPGDHVIWRHELDPKTSRTNKSLLSL